MRLLGQSGNYLAAPYMLTPAIAAVITRAFFYKHRFRDANLKLGRIKDYLKYWGVAMLISTFSIIVFWGLGSISFDFSGNVFLDQLAGQMALTGQDINDLPAGFTPQIMLILFFIGGLTVFNIVPGIIAGFGEEFGWRGLMFPLLYRIRPWVGFIAGGLIWFLWHIPLTLVFTAGPDFTITQNIINTAVLAISSVATFVFLAYVYIKTQNIFVASVAHITLNNSARSFSYFIILKDQLTANVGLAITMVLVVLVLYYMKELRVFKEYFSNTNMSIGNAQMP